MFYNISFVKKNLVGVFGKDLNLLRTSLHRWDYIEADRLKLLVVVQEPSVINERHMLRAALIEAASTSYMWHTDQHTLLSQLQLVQMCIIFFSDDISVSLDAVWSKDVSLWRQHRRHQMLDTWYSDLRRAHHMHQLTSPDPIIEFFNFNFLNETYYVVGLVRFEATRDPFTVYLHVEQRGLNQSSE